MAQFFDRLSPDLSGWLAEQSVFFVASACAEGRINLSPKGGDALRCLDETRVAYLDLTGSGNETSAHIQHDGRLTLMACSFDRSPRILRLYGRGEVVRPDDAAWAQLAPHFPDYTGARQIIVLHIESAQTSCGYGVPTADAMHPRNTLIEWAEKKGRDEVLAYQREKNGVSIDGFPVKL
jgi:hypothetical protein